MRGGRHRQIRQIRAEPRRRLVFFRNEFEIWDARLRAIFLIFLVVLVPALAANTCLCRNPYLSLQLLINFISQRISLSLLSTLFRVFHFSFCLSRFCVFSLCVHSPPRSFVYHHHNSHLSSSLMICYACVERDLRPRVVVARRRAQSLGGLQTDARTTARIGGGFLQQSSAATATSTDSCEQSQYFEQTFIRLFPYLSRSNNGQQQQLLRTGSSCPQVRCDIVEYL